MIQLKISSYTDITYQYSNSATLLQRLLDVVASGLNQFISGPDATIDLAIRVLPYDSPTALTSFVHLPFDAQAGRVTLQSVSEREALTGIDGNGNETDALIYLSRDFMQRLALWSANPSSSEGAVVDELLRHEVLHTLGWSGFRNKTTGALPETHQSVFDTFITIENGKPFFTGPTAVAIYGGKVPLARLSGDGGAVYHIDGTAVGLKTAIMAPVVFSNFTELDVELAMTRDLGYSIRKLLISPDSKTFIPGTSADTVTGSSLFDKAIYSGRRADYTVASDGKSITFRSKASETDVDQLSDIDRVHFSDAVVAFDGNGHGGQAYRLYQAAFDRKPDPAGLGYWIGILDSGHSLQVAADAFLNSSEFQSLYGTAPSNAFFVDKLYRNILHRAPEAEGYDYWLDILDRGIAGRAQVLAEFSESVENRAALMGVMQNGIEYLPYG